MRVWATMMGSMMLTACGAGVEALGEAPLFCGWTLPDGTVRVGEGLLYGGSKGCNYGQCSCPDGECQQAPSTTSAACIGTPEGASSLFPRCRHHADCGAAGFCILDAGCEEQLGHCVQVQSQCTERSARAPTEEDEVVYCGCDGQTYGGRCPVVPYRHAGPCS